MNIEQSAAAAAAVAALLLLYWFATKRESVFGSSLYSTESENQQNKMRHTALVWFGFLLFLHPATNLYSWMHHRQFSWIGHDVVVYFPFLATKYWCDGYTLYRCQVLNLRHTHTHMRNATMIYMTAVNLMMEIVLSCCAQFLSTILFWSNGKSSDPNRRAIVRFS